MPVLDRIIALTRSLFPRGRAFRMPAAGDWEKLTQALAKSEQRGYDDAVSVLNSALPDNDSFSSDDASAWERRLGIISNPSVALADRKLAIIRKMNHPGTIPARQHYLYLQGQLQAAGFDVYVYENRFPDYPDGYVTQTPGEFSDDPYPSFSFQYGDFQYGDFQYGGTWGNQIANSIYQSVDDNFDLGSNLRSTFFIGGPTPGSWANVDSGRELEFRQLILLIKPVQTVGFLLINYV